MRRREGRTRKKEREKRTFSDHFFSSYKSLSIMNYFYNYLKPVLIVKANLIKKKKKLQFIKAKMRMDGEGERNKFFKIFKKKPTN